MADEVSTDKDPVVEQIKDDASDSPEHASPKESADNQSTVPSNSNGTPKDWRAWSEEETRTLIRLYKTSVLKYPEYSKKSLWQEISRGLAEFGYRKHPERVRNRLKTLRTSYRRVVEYNSNHVLKKEYQFMDDLADVFDVSPAMSDDNSGSSVVVVDEENESNNSYTIADDGDVSRKLRFVRTKSPKSDSEFSIPSKIKKVQNSPTSVIKKNVAKKSFCPMFQCGLCLGKFPTSNQMHSHECIQKNQLKVNVEKSVNNSSKKKIPVPAQSGQETFHWDSMSTLQFLIFLKDCKMKPKNSNIHRNLLDSLSTMMKKHGIIVSPEALEKKWRCLAGNYEKTVAYNKKHKDKKKCAFFNRLTELYNLGSSLDMFRAEEPVKMTVEVSPFSYSSNEPPRKINGRSTTQRSSFHDAESNSHSNNSSDLVKWLNMFWTEWKDLEREREAAEAQRHLELMEILSYVADGLAASK